MKRSGPYISGLVPNILLSREKNMELQILSNDL